MESPRINYERVTESESGSSRQGSHISGTRHKWAKLRKHPQEASLLSNENVYILIVSVVLVAIAGTLFYIGMKNYTTPVTNINEEMANFDEIMETNRRNYYSILSKSRQESRPGDQSKAIPWERYPQTHNNRKTPIINLKRPVCKNRFIRGVNFFRPNCKCIRFF
jgi:hypothetical protein